MADAAAGHSADTGDAIASSSGAQHRNQPPCFLIVYNVSKRHNIGNIARCASAFGVTQVCRSCYQMHDEQRSINSCDHTIKGPSFKHG